jgi:hypothetical protein
MISHFFVLVAGHDLPLHCLGCGVKLVLWGLNLLFNEMVYKILGEQRCYHICSSWHIVCCICLIFSDTLTRKLLDEAACLKIMSWKFYEYIRIIIFRVSIHSTCHIVIFFSIEGLSWSWSCGSWIYNYLCNQCLSSLTLLIPIPLMARCTRYNLMW